MRRNDIDIYQPNRQSIAAILILIAKFLRRIISATWPALVVYFFRNGSDTNSYMQILFLSIGGLSLIGSILSYFKFFFHVTDKEIIISKGILKKTNLTIPFDRVQSVDFEQNLIHQMLNVVKVKIDTAGSVNSELDIDALELPIAEKLRSFVINNQKLTSVSSSLINDESEVDLSERQILKLDVLDLLKVGIAQNHIRTAGLILAFGLTILSEIEQIFQGLIYDRIDHIDIENGDFDWFAMAFSGSLLAIILLFLSFLLSLVLVVVRYYDLHVSRNDKGFKLVAGLFNRKEKSAVHRKVQILRWQNNLIQRMLGLFKLNILQAASEIDVRKGRFVIPGMTQSQLSEVISEYYSEQDLQGFKVFKVHPLMIYRYTLFFAIIPSAVAGMLGYFLSIPNLYFVFFLIPVVLVWTIFYRRNWRLEVNEVCVRTTSGVFGRKSNLFKIFKIQSVVLQQSWYQRRNDLANVNIHTAGGSIVIPYLDIASGRKLKNYFLYRVEISKKPWM